MELFTVLTGDFTVADTTIIAYSGDDFVVRVPAKLDGHPIRHIGDGAFENCGSVGEIIIEEGIKNFGVRSFARNDKLKKVFIPWTVEWLSEEDEVSKEEDEEQQMYVNTAPFAYNPGLEEIIVERKITPGTFASLQQTSIPLGAGCYILSGTYRNFVQTSGTEELNRLLCDERDTLYRDAVKAAVQIYPEVERIFCAGGLLENELNETCRSFTFYIGEEVVGEEEALRQKMNDMVREPYNVKWDEKNDDDVRMEKNNPIPRTYITWFDEKENRVTGNEVIVTLHMEIGEFFWQSVKKIVMNGTDYYVYRKEYLNSQEERPYIQKDIGVFKKEGIIMEEEEKNVYAKYRLLSML